MAPPEIVYFEARGRAEPVRLCYALKGIEWTESRPVAMHTVRAPHPSFAPSGTSPPARLDGGAVESAREPDSGGRA